MGVKNCPPGRGKWGNTGKEHVGRRKTPRKGESWGNEGKEGSSKGGRTKLGPHRKRKVKV